MTECFGPHGLARLRRHLAFTGLLGQTSPVTGLPGWTSPPKGGSSTVFALTILLGYTSPLTALPG